MLPKVPHVQAPPNLSVGLSPREKFQLAGNTPHIDPSRPPRKGTNINTFLLARHEVFMAVRIEFVAFGLLRCVV
jgi:hypothetical protein